MSERKSGELIALVEWIKTFPQLQYLQDEKENGNSSPHLLEDPQVTSSIFDVALEVYGCDGDETVMTHAGEVWDNILSLTRKTSKRKLLDGVHSEDWGVDAKYDALTSLLHGAVSHPDMKVRADYVGRITKMPDQNTQKSLMDLIARQKQEIEGSSKEKRIKRSHAAHAEANTPARRTSRSRAPSARKPHRTPFTPKSGRSKSCESDGTGARSLFSTPQRTSADNDSEVLERKSKAPGFLSPGLGDTAEYEKEVQGLREQNEQLLATLEKYKRSEEAMKMQCEAMEIKYRNEMMKIETASCQRNEEIEVELQGKINRLESDLSEVLKQLEANDKAKAELDTMRDEMEVLKHTKSLLDDTTERLNNYKEKLAQLTDIKDALDKEEEAHSRSVDENIRLKNELSSLYAMKRNLDDYKSRAVEAEVRFAEVQDELTKLKKNIDDTANEDANLKTVIQSQKEEIENLRRQTRHEESAEIGGSRLGSGLSELNPEIKEELLLLRNENAQLREFADKREEDSVMKLERRVEDASRLAERYKSQFLSTKGKLETTQSDLEKAISQEQRLQDDLEKVTEESRAKNVKLGETTLELVSVRQNLDESRKRESMLEEELSSWVEQARALQDRTDEMACRLRTYNRNLEDALSRETLLKDKIADLEMNVEKSNHQASGLSRQLEIIGKQLSDSNEHCEDLTQDLSEWVEKAKSASELANDISDNLAGCAAELNESRCKSILLQRQVDDVSKVLQLTQIALKEEQQRLHRAQSDLQQSESMMELAKRRGQLLQSDLQSANAKFDDTSLMLEEKEKIVRRLEDKLQNVLEEKQQLHEREESLTAEVQEFRMSTQALEKQISCLEHEAGTLDQDKCEALKELDKSQEEALSLRSHIAKIESSLDESHAKAETYLEQTHSLESKLVEAEENLATVRNDYEKLRNRETEAKELLIGAQGTIQDLNETLNKERITRASIEEEMELLRAKNKKVEADLHASIEDWRTKWQKESQIARGHKQEIIRLNEVLNESQSALSAAQHRENMLQHKIRVLEDEERELKASIEATTEAAKSEILEATMSFESSREILNAKATKDVEEMQQKMSLQLEEERKGKRQIESKSKERLKQLEELMEREVAKAKDEAARILEKTQEEARLSYELMQKEYDETICKLKDDANRESTNLVQKGKGMLKELKIKQLEERGKLENKIKTLGERCSALLDERESAINSCNSKVREYRKKLQFASGRITQLTTESDDFEGQIETLSRELKKLREENDRYRRQLGGRFGAESNAQNEMLRKELKSACDELHELKQQKGALQSLRTNDDNRALASQSTISQLRTEYEETIEALSNEKRELVMKNSAAITDVQKAEMRAWETEKENSALKEQLVSLRLQVERLEKNNSGDHQQTTDNLSTNSEGDENVNITKNADLSQNRVESLRQQDKLESYPNSTEEKTQLPTVFQQRPESPPPSDERPPECVQS